MGNIVLNPAKSPAAAELFRRSHEYLNRTLDVVLIGSVKGFAKQTGLSDSRAREVCNLFLDEIRKKTGRYCRTCATEIHRKLGDEIVVAFLSATDKDNLRAKMEQANLIMLQAICEKRFDCCKIIEQSRADHAAIMENPEKWLRSFGHKNQNDEEFTPDEIDYGLDEMCRRTPKEDIDAIAEFLETPLADRFYQASNAVCKQMQPTMKKIHADVLSSRRVKREIKLQGEQQARDDLMATIQKTKDTLENFRQQLESRRT